MADRVRAALVCLTLDHGGAERHLLKLCRALQQTRISPLVVVLDRDARNDLRPLFEAAGIPLVFPPHARNHPGVISWLVALLRSGDVDVAHSFLWRPDVTLALAARIAAFRHVICSEQGDRVSRRYWTLRWLPRRLLDRAFTFRVSKTLVSNSAAGVDAAVQAGYPRDRILLIHYWVEPSLIDAYKPSAEDVRRRYGLGESVVIGFVGRLASEKGAADFVRAAGAISARLRDRQVAFMMVGDGPLRADLETQSREAGLAGRFVFTGAVDIPFSLMHAMDIGVICSPSESFPNVLLEFMACGKPVVGTRVGGVAEAIEDGVNGRLVPYGSIDLLAEACLDLARRPESACTMGKAARQTIESRYQMANSVSQYVALYEQTAAQP